MNGDEIRGRLPPYILLGLLLAGGASAQVERTLRAGESYTETLFGKPLTLSERDRTRVTAISLGFQWISEAVEQRVFVPAGSFFFWRNPTGGDSRLRAVVRTVTRASGPCSGGSGFWRSSPDP